MNRLAKIHSIFSTYLSTQIERFLWAKPGKALRIVIPNEERNLVLSGKDCLVASLLAMTFIKESLNLGFH
jgi:hypothetical protein